MFGLGFGELVVIALVIFLLFGPEALPEIARNLGKMFKQFREEINKINSDINSDDKNTST
jgi:sec-independent protein translocase protein TatA